MHLVAATEGFPDSLRKFALFYNGRSTPHGVITIRKIEFCDIVFPEEDKDYVLNQFRGHGGRKRDETLKEWNLDGKPFVPKDAEVKEESFKFTNSMALMSMMIKLSGGFFGVEAIDWNKVDLSKRLVDKEGNYVPTVGGMHIFPLFLAKDKKVFNDSNPKKEEHYYQEMM